MVLVMMRTGATLEGVLDLDVVTFNALVVGVVRVEYRDKAESAWTAMIAAQGKEKDMRKWLRQWEEAAGTKKSGTASDFLRDFGRGIKGR